MLKLTLDNTIGHMGAANALGFVLAIVCGMLAMSAVNSLQDLSKPITTGGLNSAVGTSTFLMLLVVVVIGIGAVVGTLLWARGR